MSCSSAAHERLGVEPHARADLRDADRVDDEVLARLAPLVGVVLAGEDERLLDARAVDLDRRVGRVLLDDREEVAEQPALERREIGALDRGPAVGMLGNPDRRTVDPAPRVGADGRVVHAAGLLSGHALRVLRAPNA